MVDWDRDEYSSYESEPEEDLSYQEDDDEVVDSYEDE